MSSSRRTYKDFPIRGVAVREAREALMLELGGALEATGCCIVQTSSSGDNYLYCEFQLAPNYEKLPSPENETVEVDVIPAWERVVSHLLDYETGLGYSLWIGKRYVKWRDRLVEFGCLRLTSNNLPRASLQFRKLLVEAMSHAGLLTNNFLDRGRL